MKKNEIMLKNQTFHEKLSLKYKKNVEKNEKTMQNTI